MHHRSYRLFYFQYLSSAPEGDAAADCSNEEIADRPLGMDVDAPHDPNTEEIDLGTDDEKVETDFLIFWPSSNLYVLNSIHPGCLN